MARAKSKEQKSAEEEKPSIVCRCHFRGTQRQFTIDVLDLTFEEQAILEEYFDEPFEFAKQRGWIGFSAKGKIAIAYLARRRREPEYTLEQATEELKKFEAAAGGEDAERPTPGDSKDDGSQS